MEQKISPELRDYIERLHYEAERYEDLMHSVRQEHLTDEEWKNSLDFYRGRCEAAQMEFRAAKESVSELYPDFGEWYLDYSSCTISDEPRKENGISVGYVEQYSERILRLYPEYRDGKGLRFGDKAVKDVTLQVTDGCNMACVYCYQHDKGNHSMTFDTAKAFLTLLLDSEKTGGYLDSRENAGIILNFIGGEPWMEIDLITQISDWFIAELFRRKHPWATRYMFGVCSNGLLHFDPRVQAYIKRHSGHLSYNISIDGNKALHDACRVDKAGNGTYDRAMAAVMDYTKGAKIGSKMTIAPGNVRLVAEALKDLIGHGYRGINLNCVYEEGWTEEHAAILYGQLKEITDWLFENGLDKDVELSIFSRPCGKPLSPEENQNWCGGVGLMLACDYKGDIYPCLRYMESSVGGNQPPYSIGNLDSGINAEPEHKKRLDCLKCITRRSQSTDECFDCPIAQGCGWCSAHNYECFGTPDKRATFACGMHKARVLANVYYWRRRGVDFPMNCPEEWAVPIIGQDEYNRLLKMEVVR